MPAADTYVDSSNPTANFGTSTQIRTDGSPTVNSYMRFNVSNVTGNITKVQLLIYANSNLSVGIDLHSVADNTWSETTMTWNTAPSLGSQLAVSSNPASGTWFTFDLTSTGYITGNGTYSFGITDPSSTALSMAARELGSHAEQLVITSQ